MTVSLPRSTSTAWSSGSRPRDNLALESVADKIIEQQARCGPESSPPSASPCPSTACPCGFSVRLQIDPESRLNVTFRASSGTLARWFHVAWSSALLFVVFRFLVGAADAERVEHQIVLVLESWDRTKESRTRTASLTTRTSTIRREVPPIRELDTGLRRGPRWDWTRPSVRSPASRARSSSPRRVPGSRP